MKENTNTEFLNYIYQNAEMGILGINNIDNIIEDEKFKDLVKKQKEEYKSISDEAIKIFISYGTDEKEISKMTKLTTYMMTKMKTINDSSVSNLAKMMIEGSNKGIIEITENLNKYPNADKEIVDLAQKLLAIEEKNLEDLKPFL